MRTLKQLTMAVAALCLAATTPLRAQTLSVYAQLTLQQQDFSTLSGGVYTDRVTTTRLTTTGLLSLLADAYPSNFPNGFPFGARLVLVNYDYFQVQAFDGSILLTNVSDVLTYSDTYNDDDFLYRGREDTITGAMSYTYYYRATIQFDDHLPDGISFTFTGNLQEKYFKSTADSSDRRLYQDSWTLNGTGQGHIGTDFFILSGNFVAPTVRWVSQDP